MSRIKPKLENLIKIESLDKFSDEDAIQIIGTIQDMSYKKEFLEGMNHALRLADSIKERNFSMLYSAYYHYTFGNIWYDRYKLQNPKKLAWKWECQDYNQIIIHYRIASREVSALKLSNPGEIDLYSKITTNLANNLSHLGRIIEAIENWNNCLIKNDLFGMARGNLGHGLMQYSKNVYDSGHKAFLLREAYKNLHKAFTPDITPEAKKGFSNCLKQIESWLDKKFLNEEIDLNKWELGNTNNEKRYRRWCLDNRLFLNPLNELGNFSIAAQDVLHLPDIILKIDEKPFHHGLYNVIKQEYVAARYLLFESTLYANQGEMHYADKGNLMVDTLDYSFHSIGIEKMKLTFRMAYSIFDKIAFFMNEYFKLEVKHHQVNFKTIWYTKRKKENGIREEFDSRENWPLRGLYWLGKDLFETNNEFKNCLEPDAKEINKVRNHLEHRYLKVHMFKVPDEDFFFSDSLCYSISRDNLFEKTLRVLKLSRAAIMYLSFAVNVEETIRKKELDQSIVAPIMSTELFEGLRF
ncbi:MAG: hypothetical protein JJU37_15785 [Balneolaceae bacterium]|nr:hypothetical protein [Balneolaceae bacterium]